MYLIYYYITLYLIYLYITYLPFYIIKEGYFSYHNLIDYTKELIV